MLYIVRFGTCRLCRHERPQHLTCLGPEVLVAIPIEPLCRSDLSLQDGVPGLTRSVPQMIS